MIHVTLPDLLLLKTNMRYLFLHGELFFFCFQIIKTDTKKHQKNKDLIFLKIRYLDLIKAFKILHQCKKKNLKNDLQICD